jgi:hypothetical protein
MRPVSFRILYFPKLGRYLGIAWNYEHACMFATPHYGTYTAARGRLEKEVEKGNCELKWFDGEYELAPDGETLVPMRAEHLRR